MQTLIRIRNLAEGTIYRSLVKRICFTQDAEQVHNFFIKMGAQLGSSDSMKTLTSAVFSFHHLALEQTLCNIRFKNPIGLSAGFDKNAELLKILPEIGFGFAEVGSITALPCTGNSGIRITRIPQQKSIWVNLGLNNRGAKEISQRLKNDSFDMPFGVSIAKTNCKETCEVEVGINDYLTSLNIFSEKNIGNYYTLNISCPNAYGGQPFHDPKLYEMLLKKVSKMKIKKPIFVKISPDIEKDKINKIIAISQKYVYLHS